MKSGTWSVATSRIGFWTWIWEAVWTWAGSGLLISMLKSTSLITLLLLMWKWMGLFLRKSYLLWCWGWLSPYSHAWNTVVMSGVVLLVAIWNCWISYKQGYAGCWSFNHCLSWTLGSLSKYSQLKSFLQVLLW